MNWFRRVTTGLLQFDRPDSEYELLETEHGAPSLFGLWRERPAERDVEPDFVSASLRENLNRLKSEYRADINPDIIFRPFRLGNCRDAVLVFINGMADSDQINDFILRPGIRRGCLAGADENALDTFLIERVFVMQEAEAEHSWDEVKTAVSEGRTVVLVEGMAKAVLMDTRGYVSRSVGEPQTETVILGPREAFTENLRTNITLLRRIIKTDDFVCEFRKAGGVNNTRIAIAYREGVANPSLVNEIKKRLAKVNTLMVFANGTLEQLTERNTYSPLPQSLSTERPDRAAAHIMQGHVAVIVEGTPIVSVAPATLFTLMSSAEDTYMRQPVGTIVRVVRYVGAFLSIVMPGYFISLALHHQGMLSGEVLATVVASRNMVFLPLAVEMIFLLLVFQLVREAGLSVPNVLGQSVGIIGGLILGQAAVSANIVSTVVLIIVALTGLGNFTIRDYSTQISASWFRIALVLAGWAGGLLAFSAVILLTVAWMAKLKSYGVPFLSPLSPRTYAKAPVIVRGKVRQHKRANDYVNAGGSRI